MTEVLADEATEKGTYIISVAFTDENDTPVTPNAGKTKWTLTDRYGNPINARKSVAIVSASTIYIVLTGNDLQILSSERENTKAIRRVTVYTEYNSANGNDMPLYDSCEFKIKNLKYVS